jgi:hypothetical protein
LVSKYDDLCEFKINLNLNLRREILLDN